MEGKTQHKLGSLFVIFWGLVAAILDLVTFFIPGAGDVVGPIFWPLMGFIFWIKGMGFINGKRLTTGVISLVAELIPIVQALPTIFASFMIIVAMTRTEEKTGLSITSGLRSEKLHGNYAPQITQRSARNFTPLNKDGGKSPVNARVPLNQNGVRAPKKESEDDIKRRERSERTRKAIEDGRKATNDRLATEAERDGIRGKGSYVEDTSSPTGYTYKYGDVKKFSDDETLARSG